MTANKQLEKRRFEDFEPARTSNPAFIKARENKSLKRNFKNNQANKTVADFLNEVLEENPFDTNLKPKAVEIVLDLYKPVNKMSAADYNKAAWRALFKYAGFGLLSEREIDQAVAAMEKIGWSSRNRGFAPENLKGFDMELAPVSFKTNNLTIEGVKRAGCSVVKYQNYMRKMKNSKN